MHPNHLFFFIREQVSFHGLRMNVTDHRVPGVFHILHVADGPDVSSVLFPASLRSDFWLCLASRLGRNFSRIAHVRVVRDDMALLVALCCIHARAQADVT